MLYKSPGRLAGTVLFFAQISVGQQAITPGKNVSVPLHVEAGTPLRLYITHRAWYRINEPVEAKFVEPVWAFDQIVIPAGTVVRGRVAKLDPVPAITRAMAIVRGDFTPLKRAEVSFTTLTLPDGRTMQLQTQNSFGLLAFYAPPRASKKVKKAKLSKEANPGKRSVVSQFLRQQAQNQANARSMGLYELVRGPSKREWLENFFLSKLPYRPQWYRAGTRFDAVLEQPLNFGSTTIARQDLASIGTHPQPDTIAQIRFLSTFNSADSHVGDPLQAVLSQPLFSTDHKLVLPEGTRLDGKITLAHPARVFHRGGKLRFAFDQIEVPPVAAGAKAEASSRPEPVERTRAQLAAVEPSAHAVKVDSEGTAKSTESKTRFLRPAIAGLVAAKSLDNDTGKQTASGTGSPNTGGRALGGFSGFGFVGIAAVPLPHPVAAALGFYGLAWSVYSNVVARGSEVKFEKNAPVAIRFGQPPTAR